jgi:hypothetical protein
MSAASGTMPDQSRLSDTGDDATVRARSSSVRRLSAPDADLALASAHGTSSEQPVSWFPDAADAAIHAPPSLAKARTPTLTRNEAK